MRPRDERAHAPSWRERIEIISAFLFLIVGAILLIRVADRGGGDVGILIGGGMVALGAYRVGTFIRYHWSAKERPDVGR